MIKIDFKWQLHKWRAITFIVLGRKSWAIETFEDMLADYPNDAYALGRFNSSALKRQLKPLSAIPNCSL